MNNTSQVTTTQEPNFENFVQSHQVTIFLSFS